MILKNYKPAGKLPECPLGWDWTKKYRLSLIERGELNMRMFTRAGFYPEDIDFRQDQIDFSETSRSYTQQSAEFSVTRQAGNSNGLLLSPVQ